MKRFGLNSGYIGIDRRQTEAGIAPLQKAYLERIRGGGYLPGVPLLLDLYPGAIGAWSLRKLRAGYGGTAIRVRRASDNVEQNIGFDTNGELDTSALTAFCTGTNGFITTWFDQASNKNAVQNAAISQPKIYDSITGVSTQNGKPTVSFDGNDDFLDCGLINGGTKPANYSSMNVSRYSSLATTRFAFGSINAGTSNSNSYNLSGVRSSKSENGFGNGVGGATVANSTLNHTTNQQLNSAYYTGGNTIQMYRDGLGLALTYLLQSASTCAGTEFKTSIGRAGETISIYFIGDQQENIVYPSDQTTNRVAIENNIKAYYGIL